MRVADILKSKGPRVVTIRPTETMGALSRRMRLENVGSVVVSHAGLTLDGIISERDLVNGLATHGGEVEHRPVSEFMTKHVTTCAPSDSVVEIARTMTQRRIRHLPVVQDGRLIGLVSIGDVLKHRMEELKLEADVMRDYAIAAAR